MLGEVLSLLEIVAAHPQWEDRVGEDFGLESELAMSSMVAAQTDIDDMTAKEDRLSVDENGKLLPLILPQYQRLAATCQTMTENQRSSAAKSLRLDQQADGLKSDGVLLLY